jgi:ABC-type branched-subunit amino acid transport system ATPase component
MTASTEVAPEASVQTGSETLRLDCVTVRFGGVTALKDVDLSASEGEIVGLIGPNGSGKTTILNVATGLVRATAGTVTIDSVRCSRMSVHRRAQMGLARTFQRVALFEELTVHEHITLAREVKHLWRANRDRTSGPGSLIDAVDMVRRPPWNVDPNQPVSALSLGSMRAVELAMAITGSPKVLLLDEPLSGLDSAEREAIGEMLIEIRENHGVTVILVEHDVDSVVKLADRLVVLDFGVKIADGPTWTVMQDNKVRRAYFGGES